MYRQKSLIGIKGRLQTKEYEPEEKPKQYFTEVIAERVTFLSNSKEEKA